MRVTNLHVHGMCICISMFYLLFLGLKRTTSFCLYTVPRLIRRIDSIYNPSPCEVVVPYKTALLYSLLTGLWMDIFTYICISERDNIVV